jgi:hypothetical protein
VADPVAWKVVERGWDVVASDGETVGAIEQVLGDAEADIFDGLAVARGGLALERPRYVPSEQVGPIEEGTVHLTIDASTFEGLEAYEGPPPEQPFFAP